MVYYPNPVGRYPYNEATTQAVGEEGGQGKVTSLAVGEEGGEITTRALYEEGGSYDSGSTTTNSLQEEGGSFPFSPTSQVWFEQGGQVGQSPFPNNGYPYNPNNPYGQATTQAVGEEGGGITTRALGEEGASIQTQTAIETLKDTVGYTPFGNLPKATRSDLNRQLNDYRQQQQYLNLMQEWMPYYQPYANNLKWQIAAKVEAITVLIDNFKRFDYSDGISNEAIDEINIQQVARLDGKVQDISPRDLYS